MVLLDNGRSAMIGTELQDMLRCIRCGACMNHCPVYLATGGHAYGWVYPGPMGAVLTPSLHRHRAGPAPAERLDLLRPLRGGLPDAHPAAASMMRHWREQQFAQRLSPPTGALRHPALGVRRERGRALYHLGARLVVGAARRRWGGRTGRFRRLPLAGGWTGTRDLPAPAGPDLPGQMARRARVGR